MNKEKNFPTVKPVKLTVKTAPKGEPRGYTIYHNQKVGWAGTLKVHFGWYKFKKDAVKSADGLELSYNK